jgi:hypothetical protein
MTNKESPEVQRKRIEAIREAYKLYQDDIDKDENSWWNKAKVIHYKESKDMLDYYMKIYSYYNDLKVISKNSDPRFQEHFLLNTLLTDREKEENALKQAMKVDFRRSPNELSEEMMKRQPRNTDIKNYNFEEHKQFARLHSIQMEADRQKQLLTKRIFKYILVNPDDPLSKSWKRKLLFGKESFKADVSRFVDDSVSIKDFTPPLKMKQRRIVVKTRHSTDISEYDSWI